MKQCSENKHAYNALVKIEQNISITQSITHGELIQTQGKKIEVVKEIIRCIEFFLEVTGRKMETFQIQILAGDLYEKFRCDTIEDIILMLKMARQGDFGTIYKVDVTEVMMWANKYIELKADERERLHREKRNEAQEPKDETKEEPKGKYFHELPPELQEKFNKLTKGFVPTKATNMLQQEQERRRMVGEKPKPIKFKKYI